ncbi:MAG: Stp1/IreP family PP2C-type Ser/Thr phosphatase [Clostridiales bacterium]|nr:Stp1/IreP family PP2C-type Ser/Thr phosphatase [Clostridiales bacterium]
MKFNASTDIGKVKENNEDNLLTISNDSISVFAVADGMGGHDFGEEASLIAITFIENNFNEFLKKKNIKKEIQNMFLTINQLIYKTGISKNAQNGMGTTLTLAIIIDEILFVGHIGDSRCYIINNEIIQLTKDHSYVEQLIDKGMITKLQAKTHPKKNIITRALGTMKNIEVDIVEYQLEKSDSIMLCTDGLSNLLDDNEMKNIINKTDLLKNANVEMVKLANNRGGFDNITVIVVRNN